MADHTTRSARTQDPIERFWKYVDAGALSDCWEWQGALRNGYGVLNIDGKVVYMHRFSYELHFGPLNEGQCTLHKCDNRRCCNPYHLFAGTKGDNNRDTYAKGRGNIKARIENGGPKLTDDQVHKIRQLVAQGVAYPALAKQFGVTKSYISMIAKRKRWRHLP